MREKNTYKHFPICLNPSPFPKIIYDNVVGVQYVFNKLYLSLSKDSEFLKLISDSVPSDEFVQNLYLLSTLRKKMNPLGLTIFRSDYMLDGYNSGYLQKNMFLQ